MQSAITVEIPKEKIKQINNILFKFIWNKKDRIKRQTLIGPINKGGLNMVDSENFFMSLKYK